MNWSLNAATIDGVIEIDGEEHEAEVNVDNEGNVVAECKEENEKTREFPSIKGAMDDLECTLSQNRDDDRDDPRVPDCDVIY